VALGTLGALGGATTALLAAAVVAAGLGAIDGDEAVQVSG
jgi:hypothetical protein